MAEGEKKTRKTSAKAKEKKQELTLEEKDISLEDAFAGIEDVIHKLENEDLSLDDSFKYYQEGMELLKFCNHSVDAIEKKVLKMNENGELDEF